MGSPFLQRLPLAEHGLEYLQPEIHAAHPLDDGSAVVLHRSVSETAAGLGVDAGSYESLMGPLVRDWDEIADLVLGPPRLPRHPLSAARFARARTGQRVAAGAGAFGVSGRGRCWRAWPPTRCCR